MAEGLWIKCDSCKEIVYRAEVEKAGRVCPKCRYPFRISARERIALLADAGSFEEHVDGLTTTDPLSFKDTKRYRDRIRAAREKTGMEEAVICGLARIADHPVVLAVFEFGFLGGSMGSVVGEKLTRAIELAIDKHVPVLIVAASGGARMQEGILSLMQMAKTASALAHLGAAGLPYISVLTDPTTGGVTASFAMLGDIIVAEPRALIGFAGPRVIAETIKQPLPDGFQRSEFLLEHGQIDLIAERRELRDLLRRILVFFEDQDVRALEDSSQRPGAPRGAGAGPDPAAGETGAPEKGVSTGRRSGRAGGAGTTLDTTGRS
jgi:acetyl-CoA carboxylase carboxyl transferase subunit beta